MIKNKSRFLALGPLFASLLLLAACASSGSQVKAQPTVVVSKSFQSHLSPTPSLATYRCGAWSSNNTPGTYSTITIYVAVRGSLDIKHMLRQLDRERENSKS